MTHRICRPTWPYAKMAVRRACRRGARFLLYRIAFLVLAILTSAAAESFEIRGRVVDAETNAPVPVVNVFLANTTLGAATDEQGFFTIRRIPLGSYDLFINHIGYALRVVRIDLFGKQRQPLDIRLDPAVLQGERIEVTVRDRIHWRRSLETFEREFIGTSRNAKSCRLINPQSLEFSEDRDGTLRASSDSVLIVLNESLGYRIEIILKSFSYQEKDMNYLIYPRFEELDHADPAVRTRWIRNRNETWEGSLRHFLSVLARDQFRSGLFEVYYGYLHPETGQIRSYGIPVKSKRPSFVQDEPIPELKRIRFDAFLVVLYKDYTKMHGSVPHGDLGRFPTSYLEMKVPTATINIHGNVQPYNAFKVYGAWAAHRIADLLPLDYDPGQD